ncbi:unnamed protein product [Rhizophagus irregularis]|nr:unnamed protein product [Rhizophagus irregularis]
MIHIKVALHHFCSKIHIKVALHHFCSKIHIKVALHHFCSKIHIKVALHQYYTGKSWNKVINGEGRPLPLSSPLDLKEDQ